MPNVPLLAPSQTVVGPRVTDCPPARTPLPSQVPEAIADALGHVSAALELLEPHRETWQLQLSDGLARRPLRPIVLRLVFLMQGFAELDAAHIDLTDALRELVAEQAEGA